MDFSGHHPPNPPVPAHHPGGTLPQTIMNLLNSLWTQATVNHQLLQSIHHDLEALQAAVSHGALDIEDIRGLQTRIEEAVERLQGHQGGGDGVVTVGRLWTGFPRARVGEAVALWVLATLSLVFVLLGKALMPVKAGKRWAVRVVRAMTGV